MVETVSFRAFLEANWGTYGYGYLRWPGVEVTDETGICGTDKSVPYSYGFWCRRNRYICQQSSAYGADIITPHLPQAASSPQAPQGEDI